MADWWTELFQTTKAVTFEGGWWGLGGGVAEIWASWKCDALVTCYAKMFLREIMLLNLVWLAGSVDVCASAHV